WAEDAPLGLVDPEVIDARLASPHQSLLVELPELVAVAAPPPTVAVMTFVLKAHCDSVVVETPEVLAERVVELALPLLGEERDDLVSPCDEEVAVAPDGIERVRPSDPLGIARVPGVFRGLNLLRRSCSRERGQRRSRLAHADPFDASTVRVYACPRCRRPTHPDGQQRGSPSSTAIPSPSS